MIVDVHGLPIRRRNGDVFYALVDADDFPELNTWRWTLGEKGYAQRFTAATQSVLLLHRVIMGLTKGDGLEVDHKNGVRLDNRRTNLRVVTTAQNRQNITNLPRDVSSRFRGVYRHQRAQKWCAAVKFQGRTRYLGSFDTEEEAAAVASAWRSEHMPFAVEEVTA